MRTIGWVFILFAVWLIRAGFKGQIVDDTGQFILPQVIEETLTAIITGDDAKLKELDAQTSDSGLLGPTPEEEAPQLLEGASAFTDGSTGETTPGASGKRGAVVAAARSFSGDKYSQARRWQKGYSDCSSFVGKALKKAGIKPPGASLVTSYRLSKDWIKISADQVQPGDIAYDSPFGHHMVLMTGKGQGIGQQRPGVNVRSGSMRSLFGGGNIAYKTYKGYRNVSGPVSGGGGGGGGSKSF